MSKLRLAPKQALHVLVCIGGVDGPAGVANAGPYFAAERNATAHLLFRMTHPAQNARANMEYGRSVE